MKTFSYTVNDPEGIHALPAGGMVALAKSFSSDIIAEGNGQTTDCKLIFGVMSLGIKKGQDITITCEGEDEDKASEALQRYINDNM